MIKQDILEKQVKFSYLGIGSNLGDKYANIEKAKNFLINIIFLFKIHQVTMKLLHGLIESFQNFLI